MKKVIIQTDGGARGNPGPAALGVVIKAEDGTVLSSFGEYLGHQTNNFAEYSALVRALEEAGKLGATHLDIRMDSELIVRQMNGQYKIKQPVLQELAGQALRLKKQFTAVEFTHVPRAMNTEADAEVNKVLDSVSV